MSSRRMRVSILAMGLLLSSAIVCAQSIVTVAGGGSDDGQLATDVGLFGARSILFDGDGNLIIAESANNAVRRVNLATGVITTIAGNGGAGFAGDGGPAKYATLDGPTSVAIDNKGNLYISDQSNDRIRRIDAGTGTITTFAGGGAPESGIGDGGKATDAFVHNPSGLLVDHGFLYITEIGYNANRLRQVDLATGIISSVTASSLGNFSGDGGPAAQAELNYPLGIAADRQGNIFVADFGNERIRRIDAASKIITTVAGGGTPADDVGDGGVATQAKLTFPSSVLFDASGNLVIASDARVRRVDASTQVIQTVFDGVGLPTGLALDAQGTFYEAAGGKVVKAVPPAYELVTIAGEGRFVGDGRTATAAILRNPDGVAFDSSGNLYIADTVDLIVRKVDAATGVIQTVAGNGGAYVNGPQEGMTATEAVVGYPVDVAVDPAGRFFLVADLLNGRVWKVDNATGAISTLAGGGAPADGLGDNGPATAASVGPNGISIDSAGNVLIADRSNNRVRIVDAAGIIRTIAGSGPAGDGGGGYGGDNGPATAALLKNPGKAVRDAFGNIFIADRENGLVRKVDPSGTITTYAGRIDGGENLIDDVVATESNVGASKLDVDAAGNVFIADSSFHRIRRIDAATHIITTVAGSSLHYTQPDFQGDGGPATSAKMSINYGVGAVVVNSRGDLFIADTNNNRIRAVFACSGVSGEPVVTPAEGTNGVSTAPTLTWTKVSGAFRYDVLLDTTNPPVRTLATDVAEPTFVASNLRPGTKYYWQVVSKGDPYCSPAATSRSVVHTFTTAAGCVPPAAFSLTEPADGQAVSVNPHFVWEAASGASAYDVYAGATEPPPLVGAGITATSFDLSNLPSGSYRWYVVARASCDSSRTTASAPRTFRIFTTTGCDAPAAFALTQPAAGALVGPSTTIVWNAAAGASSYDVYLGPSTDPPLYAASLAATRLELSGLAPATYSWRVVARTACDPAKQTTSATATFIVAGNCVKPGATHILFAPPGPVAAGQTYAISWSDAADLDTGGGYLVERSRDASFASIADSQVTTSTSASFVARDTGVYYHRVRAIAGCDPSLRGDPSDVRSVDVIAGSPNVIFTVQPSAVITSLGDRLEQQKTAFTLENLGIDPVQVIVGKSEIASPPFFTIVDPAGGDVFVTLQPRTPKTLEVKFSGPPNDRAASYQGVIFVASTGAGLAVTPYAFVNLKVGGVTGATPRFLSNGTPVEYVAFPGFSGTDDSSRPPLSVTIQNTGIAPMDLAAEIGPEVWLRLNADWNKDPIPSGGTRTIQLSTDRGRAPNGSALPRFTWLKLRTRDGATARLLVQDNPSTPTTGGRTSRPSPGDHSFIVPEVVSRTSPAGTLTSSVRLSNTASASVQVEVVYTPTGADGFDAAAVKSATIVLPANDVVTLTDPLMQIFGAARPASGALEIRAPREKIGFLSVISSVALNAAAGGTNGYQVPALARGDGARLGAPQTLNAINTLSGIATRVVLAETTGVDSANVRLSVYDSAGTKRGETTVSVPAYGRLEIGDVAGAFVPIGSGGRMTINIEEGGGTVAGLAIVTDTATGNGMVFVSHSDSPDPAAKSMLRSILGLTPTASSVQTYLVPTATYSNASASQPAPLRTLVGLAAPPSVSAIFSLVFIPSGAGGGPVPVQTVSVGAGATREYENVLKDAFGLPAGTQGSIRVEAPAGASVYAALVGGEGPTLVRGTLPVVPSLSQALTGIGSQKPLYLDGLDQSADSSRGNRWNVILNEMAGKAGTVTVRLYESGNRTRAIAEEDFAIGAKQQVRIDPLFGALGLDSGDRRKDRTNILAVVEAKSGGALVSAIATSVDVQSGKAEAREFVPAGGSQSSISTAAPVVPPSQPGRKRPVKR